MSIGVNGFFGLTTGFAEYVKPPLSSEKLTPLPAPVGALRDGIAVYGIPVGALCPHCGYGVAVYAGFFLSAPGGR